MFLICLLALLCCSSSVLSCLVLFFLFGLVFLVCLVSWFVCLVHLTADWPGAFFFSLWRGRKCTRLGPYNCVSSENLSEKDPKGPYMANPFTTKQTKNGEQKTPATRKSPSQICVSPQIQQQNNKGTGQGPTKTHTQKGLPWRYCYLSAGQPWSAQLRLTRSSE